MPRIKRPHKFRDPVHGFIYLSDDEKKIVDSKPFQRLRNIKQLALTHYVFHGAEHTRFGHSLGVMHLVTKAFRSAVSKNRHKFSKDSIEHETTVLWLEQILRIIALTHDLGHAPFSHAAESLFPKKPKRKEAEKEQYYEHEDFTEFIIMQTEIADIISRIGNDFQAAHGSEFNITPKIICDIYRGRLTGKNSVFTFAKTFMDSELDCDKMDYLLRDSLHCGVSYGKYDVERLLASLTIFHKEDNQDTPFLGVESGGVQAFEEFVLARYFMFIQVYFHRTRRFFDIQLTKAMAEILPRNTLPRNVETYMSWDDILVMQKLRERAVRAEENSAAKTVADRKPWTCVYTTKTHPEGDGLQLFKTIENLLTQQLSKEVFKEHFLVDTSADKLPHKVIPRKHSIGDEEAIAIVDRKTGRISTISDCSHIINNLTERINIQRIYVDATYEAEANTIVSSVTNDSGGDTNDE